MRKSTKVLLATTVAASVAALGAGGFWVLRARKRAPLSVERASEIGREHAGRPFACCHSACPQCADFQAARDKPTAVQRERRAAATDLWPA